MSVVANARKGYAVAAAKGAGVAGTLAAVLAFVFTQDETLTGLIAGAAGALGSVVWPFVSRYLPNAMAAAIEAKDAEMRAKPKAE